MPWNYEKCEEIFDKINEYTFREWLINIDIKNKNEDDYLSDNWFTSGFNRFKDLNLKKEISLFHLNNKSLTANLEDLSKEVFA